MGEVIDLEAFRRARRHRVDRLARLDDAVGRVERLIAPRRDHPSLARIERELEAITEAVSEQRVDIAVERAERLADRLEHPTAAGH